MEEQNEKLQNEAYYGVGSFLLEIIKVVFLAFIIIVPIRVFLFQPFFVQGESMSPNFEDSNYLIINEFGYKQNSFDIGSKHLFTIGSFRDLQRQAIVVFRYPKNHTQFFIKRVIGLPGEKVEIKDGKVTIFNAQNPDGYVLDESAYLNKNLKTSVASNDLIVNLKDDEYFVLGDNRNYSSDSRVWGPVNKSEIIGEVALRAWPLNAITIY
jgi:signal peptidase I